MGNPWDDYAASGSGAAGVPPWQEYATAPVATPVSDFSGNLRLGPFDTGIPLPQAVNKGLAQFGSGMADWGLAAQQLLGKATGQDAVEKKARDAQLNDSTTGKALNFAGQIAPSFAIPFGYAGALGRAAPVVEGLVAGATQGAFQPTVPGESRLLNTGIGATFGGALPAGVAGFRRLATPADSSLADKAINQYGIPLGAADVSDSKMVKGARSMLSDMPITGYMAANDKSAIQSGFNRAVGQTFGATADSLTPGVMAASKQRIGDELDRIWDNNNLTLDGPFMQDLSNIQNRTQNLNPEQAATVNRQVQNLLSKVDANGEVPGSFVNNWQSELRTMADGEKGLQQSVLSDLRKSAINAFNRGVTGPDASALGVARGQYKAFKTIEPLMAKTDAGVAGRISGDVPPALLPSAVVQQYGSKVDQSPFADLAPIAGRYLVDRTPQTGGSIRAFLQHGLTAGGTAAAVAGGAEHFGLLPYAALGMGLGVGAQGLLGSTAAARALVSPAVQRPLLGAPQLVPALGELSRTAVQRAPIPIGLGLLAAPSLE